MFLIYDFLVQTVLIDPSAQFELLRDPMTSSAVAPIDHHHTINRPYGIEGIAFFKIIISFTASLV